MQESKQGNQAEFETHEEELIYELRRNTSAVRAIAVLLVAWIPWTLGAALPLAVGFLVLPNNQVAGIANLVLGAGLALAGAIISLVGSLKELGRSQ